jgi:hypothetical protein
MDAYFANNADFIASHILYYHEDPSWYWWTHYNRVGYPMEQSIRAFHPICRYSYNALEYVHKYQMDGYSAHSELLIPTCLYHGGLTLLDMGGTGSFIEEVTLSEIGTHFVTYIYYYCAHLSLSLPEAVHNLLSRFLCVYTVSLRVQR